MAKKGAKDENEVQGLSSDDDYRPLRAAAAAASSVAPGPHMAEGGSSAADAAPLRRSTRARTQTRSFIPMADDAGGAPVRRRRRKAGPSSAKVEEDDDEAHLDQISLEDGGTLTMRVHPCAAALMQLHVHLSKTEVIGYMGGFVLPDGVIDVAEAFPATCVQPKEMTRSGRSAYREVEMQPESDVELRSLIESKGLQVVGWYHSHPDRKFTVEPSRVDIENQNNYQRQLFKERPFVAAILAPYNEDLPDAMGAMDAFYVADDQDTPLRVPYDVVYSPRPETHTFEAYRRHLGDHLLPESDLEAQAYHLIEEGKKFRQRVHLLSEWRDGVRYVDKLRACLDGILPRAAQEGTTTGNSELDSAVNLTHAHNVRLTQLFAQFADYIGANWPESPQKIAAKKKRKK